MSVCSLFGNGSSIALDVTTDLTYSRNGTPTTSTIFNGAKISDHYRPNLPTLNLNGVVTYTKTSSGDNLLSPKEFDTFIDNLMDSQTLLSFIGTYDQAIKDRSNIVIVAYTSTRNVQHSDSLQVSMTLQQLDISNSVTKTTITTGKTSLTSPVNSKATEGKTTDTTDTLTPLAVANAARTQEYLKNVVAYIV